MYFADMYCYGKDPTLVGITGFESCIGVIYVGNNDLYAVHIPFTKSMLDGAARFAAFITANGAKIDKAGFVGVFTNGTQRGGGVGAEAHLLRQNLGHPHTVLYRLKDVRTAAVYVERQASSNNVKMYVKDNNTVTWQDGGSPRSGCYDMKFSASFNDAKVPGTLHGFAEITSANCDISDVS